MAEALDYVIMNLRRQIIYYQELLDEAKKELDLALKKKERMNKNVL